MDVDEPICNPEDPPGDGDTTIEHLPEDCLGIILDLVSFHIIVLF